MVDEATPQERLPESTLLVGRTKTGKSEAIARKILNTQPNAKVLWLSFDNTKVFQKRPELLKQWDVRIISDWDQFEELKTALVTGKEKFDIIVLDGLAALARLNQDKLAPNGMSVQQWGIMSKNVHRAVRALRDVCDVYATVLLKDVDFAEQGKKPDIIVQYDLNQDLQKRVIPEFASVLYTHYEDDVDEAGLPVRNFFVLETSAFAFQFTQA